VSAGLVSSNDRSWFYFLSKIMFIMKGVCHF